MYHNILLVFGLIILWHHDVCHWSVLTWMWCIGQFYILFWIQLESGTAYCLNWRYLHWLDIESVYFVFDAEKLILPIEKLLHFEFGLWDALALWGQWPYFFSSYLSKNFVMRCFGIVRTIPTSSSSWPRIIHLIWWCASYRSWGDFGYLYEDDTILRRLWSTLWIGYYSGRKTSAIQLYLADLHWQRRTEHSILHWSLKLWDAISMWKADLEKERCVLTMFCIQKKVVQIPCVNHFVLEKLVSLWLMSWLFTVGWEPVWFENFWKCFDVFEFILWKVSFVDL